MGNSVGSIARTPVRQPRKAGTTSSTSTTSTHTSTPSTISTVFQPVTSGASIDGSVITGTSGITLESVHEVQRQTLTVLSRILERLPEAGTGEVTPPDNTGQTSSTKGATGGGQ